jgi:low temperature requirement protein LtrA
VGALRRILERLLSQRGRPLKRLALRFLLCSLVSLASVLALFHIAALGFPLLSVLWTYFWFDVAEAATLKKAGKPTKRKFAAAAFYYSYLFVSSSICALTLSSSFDAGAVAFLAANGALALPVSFFFLRYSIRMARRHLPGMLRDVRQAPDARQGPQAAGTE